jgi:hypothetical protein
MLHESFGLRRFGVGLSRLRGWRPRRRLRDANHGGASGVNVAVLLQRLRGVVHGWWVERLHLGRVAVMQGCGLLSWPSRWRWSAGHVGTPQEPVDERAASRPIPACRVRTEGDRSQGSGGLRHQTCQNTHFLPPIRTFAGAAGEGVKYLICWGLIGRSAEIRTRDPQSPRLVRRRARRVFHGSLVCPA